MGVVLTLRRLINESRGSAAVLLLAIVAGQWVVCPCPVPMTQRAPSAATSTVQDAHACCETTGIRAQPTCCPESTGLGTSAAVTAPLVNPAPPDLVAATLPTVVADVLSAPTFAAAVSRPPRFSILRI